MNIPHRSRSARSGFALVASLVLVLSLTILIAAIQRLVAQEFASTKSTVHSNRALQLAEAGINAYLHELSNGFVSDSVPWMPPPNDRTGADPAWPVDIATFRSRAGAGDAGFPVRHYPEGNASQGFVVGHVRSGATLSVIAYGFCNGAVRMVRCNAMDFQAFQWAAAYGLDPHSQANPGPGNDRGPAWTFLGSASIVGACGAEGEIKTNNNATIYDGPIYLSGAGVALNPTFDPVPLQSSSGVPPGHSGNGVVSLPFLRRKTTSMAFKTVDDTADEFVLATTGVVSSQGIRYFADSAHNQNATGIRYLIRCKSGPNLDKIRLGNAVPVAATDPVFAPPANPSNTAVGIADSATEELFGIRFYPGNYYFTRWHQPSAAAQRVYFRTYADGGAGVRVDGKPLEVFQDTGYSVPDHHPVAALSSEHTVRVWIGDPQTGAAAASDFSANLWIEDQTYPSRFRILFGNHAGMTIGGNGADKFTANVLAYNTYVPTTGPYRGETLSTGSVTINGAYLLGSLIAWQVTVGGNSVVEKQALLERDPGDRFGVVVLDWSEIR